VIYRTDGNDFIDWDLPGDHEAIPLDLVSELNPSASLGLQSSSQSNGHVDYRSRRRE